MRYSALLSQRPEGLAAGKPFKKTLEEVESECAHSQLGGQVRRDVEQLSDGANPGGNRDFRCIDLTNAH